MADPGHAKRTHCGVKTTPSPLASGLWVGLWAFGAALGFFADILALITAGMYL
jgi:hypothetical protein